MTLLPLSQIDPDERPEFEEAVRILEQTVVVPEEGAESREGGDEDLRACFSEPLLRYACTLLVHVL